MYDLAVSENGDLMFQANRDLLGVSGAALIEQRIRTRLKIPRGSWTYDDDKSLGSRLHIVLNHDVERAMTEIPVFVREALDEMEDITILDVSLDTLQPSSYAGTEPQLLAVNSEINPSFEQSIAGYVAYQNGITGTIAKSSDFALAGTSSCKITATSAAAGSLGIVNDIVGRISVLPGEVWTVTSHTRPGSVARTVGTVVGFYDATYAFQDAKFTSYVLNEVGAWKRAPELTVTIPPGIVYMTVYTDINNPANGEIHYVDGVMAVKGVAAGQYFDGDSENCKWSGSPHYSQSERYGYAPETEKDSGGRSVNILVKYSVDTPPEGAGAPSEPNEDELIISLPL